MKMKEKQDIFYVAIKNPKHIQSMLQDVSEGITYTLKRYEHLTELRTYRAEYITKLQDNIKQIKLLMVQLRKELPELDPNAIPGAKAGQKQKGSAKPEHALTKFQDELEEIEKKLRDIEESR